MSKDYRLEMNRDLLAMINKAKVEILTSAAFVAEGGAKPRASVDTGFMRNAIYGTGKGKGGGQRRHQAMSAARGAAARPFADQPLLGEADAALHGAALYTIYQDLKLGFMMAGVDEAKRQLPGIVKAVALK